MLEFMKVNRKPTIGITADLNVEGAAPKYELKAAYAEAVLRAGGLPVLLPYADEPAVIDAFVDRLSGLVVSGGAFDVPPALYQAEPKPGLGPLKETRTAFELKILRAALSRGVPMLGVCGGMQLLNVALGGTLHQDIVLELPQAKPHQQTHDRAQPQHPVEVFDGTHLAEAVGKGQLMVNSTHHQAIENVGTGLLVSAKAPDGVIEAIETKDGVAMGVQWHPEMMIETVPHHLGLYRALVNRARDRRH
jgi:putative glutamine amidotransferase